MGSLAGHCQGLRKEEEDEDDEEGGRDPPPTLYPVPSGGRVWGGDFGTGLARRKVLWWHREEGDRNWGDLGTLLGWVQDPVAGIMMWLASGGGCQRGGRRRRRSREQWAGLRSPQAQLCPFSRLPWKLAAELLLGASCCCCGVCAGPSPTLILSAFSIFLSLSLSLSPCRFGCLCSNHLARTHHSK